MDSSSSQEVKIISKCFIKPKTISEKSKEPYYLTPLEHLFLSIEYIQKGLLFLKPESHHHHEEEEAFMETLLHKLKDSLATTLVHFYPLSGRISALKTEEDPKSYSVFVDCNNSPGAGLIYAESDLNVLDILGPKHVPLVVESFFDHHKALNGDGHTMSLISLKVTELVDGVFIGLSMNHALGDGSTFWQFFNSLSEIFNTQQDTIDDNNLLFCLKNPPIFREMSGPSCMLPFNPLDGSISLLERPVLDERMFYFSFETVKLLKSKANQECGTTTISSLQSLAAFIWRSITKARNLPKDQETTCRFAAGTRTRLNTPLHVDHFGVYVSLAKATTRTCDLMENGFGGSALKVHQAVKELNGEKISTQMDGLLVSPTVMQSVRLQDANVVHMGSSPRFNKYGPEFGMGKAVAVRSGYGGKFDGKVSAYPGREGGGSIDLEVCLLPQFMKALESDNEFMSLISSSSL
ncbi:unnamed protein product [Cochlearia groenlandica]